MKFKITTLLLIFIGALLFSCGSPKPACGTKREKSKKYKKLKSNPNFKM